jgi:hypothetical protein
VTTYQKEKNIPKEKSNTQSCTSPSFAETVQRSRLGLQVDLTPGQQDNAIRMQSDMYSTIALVAAHNQRVLLYEVHAAARDLPLHPRTTKTATGTGNHASGTARLTVVKYTSLKDPGLAAQQCSTVLLESMCR